MIRKLRIFFSNLRIPAVLFVVVAILSVGAFPSPADATDDEADNTSDQIVPFTSMQHRTIQTATGYSYLVFGNLDDSDQLPATIEIAVRTGAEVFWFGEALLGDEYEEVHFAEPHVMRTENGLDIYTAVLTTSRTVQIEYTLRGVEPVTMRANNQEGVHMEYQPLTDLAFLHFSSVLPPGSELTSPDAIFVGNAHDGSPIYAITLTDTQAMQLYSAEILFIPPWISGQVDFHSPMGGVIIAIAATAIPALAIAAFMIIRRRNKAQEEE